MGACGSRSKGCFGLLPNRLNFNSKKNNNNKKTRRRRRRRVIRRRVSSKNLDRCSTHDRSFNKGSVDGDWFDSTSVLESEYDEEFHSVFDDVSADVLSEDSSVVSVSSPRNLSFKDCNGNISRVIPSSEQSTQNPERSSIRAAKNVKPKCIDSDSKAAESTDGGNESTEQVGTTGPTDCGILQNSCLPFLAANDPPVERRKSMSSNTSILRRKAVLRLSFKNKEGHNSLSQLPVKWLVHKPIGGSSVPCYPVEKKIPNSWSTIEPSSFKVRGKNYFRDKKKDFAPNCAAYYPFGADIFLSQRKIDHIARFVELPAISSSGEVPPILVVNIQIPLYPPAIFQSDNDGEGMNVVLYFKLSESYMDDLPPQFRESINKLINDEVERVKGFPVDTIAPFRERLKILGRVANAEDLTLGGTEKKLLNAYNEKPVLSRPQHEFYLGESYLEIDLDVHRFSYISRKGFGSMQDRLNSCVLDFGLTMQGTKAEDLPEHLLCCMRLNQIDYSNYRRLGDKS